MTPRDLETVNIQAAAKLARDAEAMPRDDQPTQADVAEDGRRDPRHYYVSPYPTSSSTAPCARCGRAFADPDHIRPWSR